MKFKLKDQAKAALVAATNLLPLMVVRGIVQEVAKDPWLVANIKLQEDEVTRLVNHIRKGGNTWDFPADLDKIADVMGLPPYLVPYLSVYQKKAQIKRGFPSVEDHARLGWKAFWSVVDNEIEGHAHDEVVDAAAIAMLEAPVLKTLHDRYLV